MGSVAYGLKGTALGVVMLFYNQVMGLPVTWVSIGIGIALIVDAIVDPMIGQISDMWRSKWGRRHPFMYFSAAPTAIAVFFLLNPPHGWADPQLFAYMMACIVSARVFISMFEIPSSSLLPELEPRYDDRTMILGFRYLMGIVPPALIGVFALRVLMKPFINEDGHPMPGQLNPEGYANYGVVLAVVIFSAIMISALGTHKEIKYMRPPIKHDSLGSLLGTMATTLFNRDFLALTISGVVYAIGTGMVGGLSSYISTYFWQLSANQISLITLAGIVGPFMATALAPVLSKSLGKKKAVLITFFSAVFVGTIPVLLNLFGILPTGHPLVLPVLIVDGIFTATLGVMGFIIVSSMMADVVEQVQMKTGRRSEGLLFSADNLLKQVVSGVGAMGTGFILAAIQFPEKAVPGEVPTEVTTNLVLVYLPVMTLSSIISISVIAFYSITKEQHESSVAALQQSGALAATGSADIEHVDEIVVGAKPN
jgi:Na+/melibiose symporter-like transporter